MLPLYLWQQTVPCKYHMRINGVLKQQTKCVEPPTLEEKILKEHLQDLQSQYSNLRSCSNQSIGCLLHRTSLKHDGQETLKRVSVPRLTHEPIYQGQHHLHSHLHISASGNKRPLQRTELKTPFHTQDVTT